MNFGHALMELKAGGAVKRDWWEGEQLSVEVPDGQHRMTEPFIYKVSGKCLRGPWVPSQADMLADDWTKA